MPRSAKDSDDEAESKTGRMPTRMLSTHMVNSPLRRSSRIKQAKTSPGSSESDSNNSQPTRVQPTRLTRQRTATMDSIVSETVKKRLTRHTSVSSDLNEATDIDIVGTPTRRNINRRSSLSAIATPTNTNTRAASKRLTRAGSEAKSSPHIRMVRKTRSNSAEPESLQEKSQPGTPVRIRRRASILPSGSPVREEVEERSVTPVRLNPTITETDELIDKIAVVPVLLKSDEILLLSQNKSKIQSEHADQETMDKKQTVVEGQSISEENLLDEGTSDENSAHNKSSNLLKSNQENKPNESLLQIQQSLIDLCEESSTKALAENSLNTSTEEQKKNSPSNKENQTSNIINGASAKKNLQPVISSVVSLSAKTSAFVSKLDEKEKESKETDKISLMNETETQEKNVSKENLDTDIIVEDSNEMNLMLEEQSQDRHENEAPSNVTFDNLPDSPINKTPLENSENQSNIMDEQPATDDVINNDIAQDDIIDNAESTEQEEKNVSEHVTKSPESSNIQTITLESTDSDVNDTIIQHNQIPETSSEKSAVDTSNSSIISVPQLAESSQETESKDVSLKSTLEQKSACDVEIGEEIEVEEESSRLEKNKKDQKDMETVDSEVAITLKFFRDTSIESSDEDDDVKSDHRTKQESEAECDLILLDKQAWLTAEDIKAQKEKEFFEYDSDDTVLLKSHLDAARANREVEALDTVSENSVNIDSKEDEAVEESKKRKSLTKKRSIFKRNKDSSPECTDDEDDTSITIVQSKISLNQSNNPSTSRLNNSEQAHDHSDEEIEEVEDDENGLNRSSRVNKKNESRKSTGGRKSLNKSLTNTSSNQDENSVQMISANTSQMDISEEDNTDAHVGNSSQRTKRSLNKSRDDETVTECEKNLLNKDKNASLNRSANNKPKVIQISDGDESDNKCDDNKALNNYSTVAHAGTDTDNNGSTDSLDVQMNLSQCNKSNNDSDNTDANSINSDIKREYNLDGTKQKFSDDNVPGDECRASESEYSDPNDSGSDLGSFIVSDDKVEDDVEEEEEDDNDNDGDDNDNDGDDDADDNDDQSVKNDDKNLEDEEVDIEILNEEGETENKDENLSEKVDIETVNEPTVIKDKMTIKNKFIKSHVIESSTPKHSADKRAFWINETPEMLKISTLETEDTKSSAKKAVKNTLPERSQNFVKGNTSLKELNHNKGKILNRSLPPDLLYLKSKVLEHYKLHKTMTDTDDDMSTIRHLIKEKLNESAPVRLDTKITPLKKKSLPREETKNVMQIETEEENNEEEISSPVMPSTDDAAQKHSGQKKSLPREETKNIMQIETEEENNEEEVSSPVMSSTDDAVQKHSGQKERNKQAGEALNEDTTDQDQEDIESETKIELANRSPMLVVKDTTSENSERINKKKKKRKQINAIEQNEDVTEDKTADSTPDIQKKKKKKKLAHQPMMLITKDNNSKDSDQINEKKKKKNKKQIGIVEQEESINEDKKKMRKNETELAQRNKKKTKAVSSLEHDLSADDRMIAKKKRKAKEMLKNRETLSGESTKNIAQIKTKKKINKKEVCDQMTLFSDDVTQKRGQKKRKRQMEESLNENTDDEAVSQDRMETKKPIKRVKFVATAEEIKFAKQRQPVREDNIYEDFIDNTYEDFIDNIYEDQVNEKRKKKKQVAEQNKNVKEENARVSTTAIKYAEHSPNLMSENIYFPTLADKDSHQTVEKKKKKPLGVIEQDNSMQEEDTYTPKPVGEKKKKKKKKQLGVSQQDNSMNEEDTCAPKSIGEKKKNAKRPTLAIKRNERSLHSFQSASADNTIQDLREIIERKKKKKQLALIEQDNNIMEDDTYAPRPVGEKKKKKKKQAASIEQDDNIMEDDACASQPVGEKKKKKKKQLASIEQDNIMGDDTYAPQPVGEKKKKKKKQLASIEQDNIMEDDTYAPQPVGEKKKKKKKQLGVIEQNYNVNEEDTYAPEAVEKKKKKKKKQLGVMQQDNDINEGDMNAPMPAGEKKKKKNKERQIEQDNNVTELNPKSKLKKNLKSGKKSQVQNMPNLTEHSVFIEAWDEAREAICAAEMRIKTNKGEVKELKKRKRPEDRNQGKIKERKKLAPSSNVKRLANDVVENLSDIPKKKKRKFLREEEISDSPKPKKPKATTAKNDSEFLLNVPGSSTQFTVINMEKAKKKPVKGGATMVASLRQKILDRNKREPVSAYMMYLEKKRVASKKKSSENAF